MSLQPPPRGCVLKPRYSDHGFYIAVQPPPRGCVLKHYFGMDYKAFLRAAASARLCVETLIAQIVLSSSLAAASARLCVETSQEQKVHIFNKAAASARLCVETSIIRNGFTCRCGSRLRAAVC